MELWEQPTAIDKELNEALDSLVENGIKACESERLYRMEKTKEILRLKKEGYPITLIQDIVKGLENIATLDFNRNLAEIVYKANLERINVRKLELRTLDNLINKEMSRED